MTQMNFWQSRREEDYEQDFTTMPEWIALCEICDDLVDLANHEEHVDALRFTAKSMKTDEIVLKKDLFRYCNEKQLEIAKKRTALLLRKGMLEGRLEEKSKKYCLIRQKVGF